MSTVVIHRSAVMTIEKTIVSLTQEAKVCESKFRPRPEDASQYSPAPSGPEEMGVRKRALPISLTLSDPFYQHNVGNRWETKRGNCY